MMSKKVVWVLVVTVVSMSLLTINFFIYPFQSSRPNFSDVSSEFDKIIFPPDWQITKIIENKGIAGRACPIEGSGCFSKQAFISLPVNVDKDIVVGVIGDRVCKSPIDIRESKDTAANRYTYYCAVSEGIMLGGDYKVDRSEISIRVFKD